MQTDVFRIPPPQPKQTLFFQARERFICYGGARGGGKSWAVQRKAELLAFRYAGIRILLLRRTFPELRENHIRPMRRQLQGFACYKSADKTFEFPNGSLIVFGYCDREDDVDQYQGQEYDVIFLDEATHFTEYQFSTLTACLRGANSFPKRMYLTCNPGNVGHAWVKRLFLDRQFREAENPANYVFIPAKVEDNLALTRHDPGYLEMLDNLPDGIRQAWRDGDWDVFIGQYFTEWRREVHVCAPFETPAWWRYYVTMDYGLDMLAAYLIAVDERGYAYVTRELYEGKDLGAGHDGVIISDAAERLKRLVGETPVYEWLAPPDLWNRRQETGRSVADIFAEHGIFLTQTSNDRVDGWMAMKEWLKVHTDESGASTARLRIFPGCSNLIRCLPMLQYDEKRPSDVATEPHEITHGPDAIRGFCVYWTTRSAGEPAAPKAPRLIEKFKPADRRRRSGMYGNL